MAYCLEFIGEVWASSYKSCISTHLIKKNQCNVPYMNLADKNGVISKSVLDPVKVYRYYSIQEEGIHQKFELYQSASNL